MSLRLRLVLVTLLLVALVAVALSALHLQTLVESLSANTISRAQFTGDQTSAFVVGLIEQNRANYPRAETEEETRVTWTAIVETDGANPTGTLSTFLITTLAQWPALLEINVADSNGRILASSSPVLEPRQVAVYEDFSQWSRLPWYRRAYDLVTQRPDWEVSPRPIGIAGSSQPVFRIQVVTSSLLVRQALLPQLEQLGYVLGAAVGVALFFTLLATTSVLRPLKRIERTIDRIVQGNFQEESGRPLAKEFQAVQNKLNLLGHQVSDARIPRGLEGMVERVATQLDVAQRLSAISRLSGGVAHEIKNPLNAILLRLDLLKVRLGEGDDEITEELDVLSREVLRLNRVVTTFLDFSRPVEVHFEDVDLAALVRDVASFIRPQAAAAKIEVECAAEGTAFMRGDADLLKQAVLNLVTNAVEAMSPTGGKLRLNVGREGDTWTLEVADTGPGIPPELRPKVFQLYFTSKSKGNGIGLAMTYRAAQLHNGTITFSSEMGTGTTFRLEFPADMKHA